MTKCCSSSAAGLNTECQVEMVDPLTEPAELGMLSWIQARDALRLRPIGLLPIGAIEAHGPHLPLDTDVIIARAMARRAGSLILKSGIPCLILPSISYSVSFAGACFPGTAPVGRSAFVEYTTSAIENLAQQGFRLICVCNAHLEPAHVSSLSQAADRAAMSSGIPVIVPDQRQEPWSAQLGQEFLNGSRHAGEYETSIVMFETPDAVRREQLEELEPVWINLPERLAAGARDFAEAGASLGYFGNPRISTREHGDELLQTLGRMIKDSVMESLSGTTKLERK